MSQCQFLFSAVFGFRKVVQEIFSEWDPTKAKVPIFPDTKTESRAETEKSHEAASPTLGAAWPWPTPRGGVAASAPSSVSALDSVFGSGKIGGLAFVSSNSENISSTTFLKYKNIRK